MKIPGSSLRARAEVFDLNREVGVGKSKIINLKSHFLLNASVFPLPVIIEISKWTPSASKTV